MKVGGLLKQQPITVLIDTGSTNNFMNNKVVVRMALHIEDCSRFDVKVTNGRILKCNRRCPWVKLLLQDQEIIANFFLLPLDDYEAVLGIEWLTTLDTTTDEHIQDKAEPWDHDAPTSNAKRKRHDKLQTQTRRSWSLSLEDKADLKRAGLLGP
ncbi:hypothetical protein BHM03_00017594 [Ensete ventricosum]|nr:hypothetical protein BHM03_00017594 [Ensete ventricosum]